MKKPVEVLQELGLPQYIDAFRENEITAEVAPNLTDEDLQALGVAALGHRKRILTALGGRSNAPLTSAPEQPAQTPRIGGSKAVADASWQANWLAWWMVIIAAGATVLSAVVSAYSLASGSGGGGVACPSILALWVIVGLWRHWRAAAKEADHAWAEHPDTPTDLDPSQTIARYKAPVIAAGLNMLCIGGLGYLYLGQRTKAVKGFGYGLGLLVMSGISLTVGDPTNAMGWIIRGGFALAFWLTVFDAYVLGRRLTKGIPVGVNETGIGLLKPILGTGPQLP